MSSTSAPNGHPKEATKTETPTTNGHPTEPNGTAASAKKRPPRPRRPNYALIHSKPLPLGTHPLPAFHPTNPISLLRLAYTYLAQILTQPSSHLPEPYIGYFSPETRSVHVTDPQHARALWEMGFFGKGTLSRSEPSWLEREKARLKAKRAGGGTAEEATSARREKRRLFKLERARAEAEKIERQKLVEEGKLDPSVLVEAESVAEDAASTTEAPTTVETTRPQRPLVDTGDISDEEPEPEPDFANQEHLQLTLEEAFFLAYSLGVLQIRSHAPTLPQQQKETTYSTPSLLNLFSAHSLFPPKPIPYTSLPDDQFLLNYIVYHHFRSLGWVVRPGVKFSVDYLLYYRGPVFSHAEFAVLIMPSYSDPYWSTSEGLSNRRVKESKDWWWLHCINRVQSQVLKTLVLVYVDVPAPRAWVNGEEDVGELLRRYKVREFVVKRWIANRSRD